MTATGHKDLDFNDDYTQTKDLVETPLKAERISELAAKIKVRVEAQHLLFPDLDLLLDRVVTGLLAGHLILAGPPGTGKTTLAKIVSHEFGCTYKVETATADWSTYDVIGGLQPKISHSGSQAFETIAPWRGVVTEAILHCARTVARNLDDAPNHPAQAHWLILDEMNRAEIDKAIGGLYTVLGGGGAEPIRLWYEPDDSKQALWVPGRFRIVATLNSVDTSYVYGFSQGLTRRFKYVYVGVPEKSQVGEEFDKVLAQAVEWLHKTYPPASDDPDLKEVETRLVAVESRLVALITLVRYGTSAVPGWPVGTAQVFDVLKELALHARATTDLEPKLDIAFADLIVPQMKDLSGTQMDLMQDAFKAGGSFTAMTHTRAAIRLLREAQNTAFA